jgi:mannosyltransferase OCH1-like enzyme/glycosyltransferase involved in cell wall biosynthesis
MVNFSVCLIGKNAEKTLPRLIASLGGFLGRGGEVVLVDTGSTDGTVEVGRAAGFSVHCVGDKFVFDMPPGIADKINARFVAEGEAPIVRQGDRLFDYAAARNHSAFLATNDVVSMPDCDEQFSVCDIDAIEEAIRRGYEQMEFHFIFSHYPNGQPAVQFKQCKMYDRRKMHWQGIVHEVLVGEAERTYLPPSVLLLEHFQLPDNDPHRDRYLAGLALDCYLNQGNDRNSHYLGRELLWRGRPKSAIKELDRHVAMNRWAQERGQSLVFIGDAWMALGEEGKALDSWHRAFLADGTRREPLLRLADYYWRKNDPQKVACYCSAALEIPPNDCYCNLGAHYTYEPHEKLYWALWWLGDRARSKEHYDKALAYDPTNPKYQSDSQFYYPRDYEYKDQGIEGWMSIGELNWLYQRAKEVGSVLELGSWKGRSTHALLSGCKGTVTCVDTFRGSVDPRDQTNAMAKAEDIFATFTKNVGHFKNLEVLRMTSREAAAKCAAEGRRFGMVFIDAGHTKEEVKEDIGLWRDMADVVLSGHDYLPGTWMGVCEAVDECVPGTEKCESIWFKRMRPEPPDRIPRRIFTVWLSEDGSMPDLVRKCIASQKAVEGYEHHVIGLGDCPKGIPYLDAAIGAKKWVKACDYVRIHELIERGGIYCDADVEILPGKDFRWLLRRSLFAGQEENGFVSTAVMGAEPGHPLLRAHLEEVVARFRGDDDKNFESSLEIITPRILAAASKDESILVCIPEVFYPYNHQTGRTSVTAHTIAFHHFLKSWVKEPGSASPARAPIPRRIFNIWLSEDGGIPPAMEKCLATQRAMKGYEHQVLTLKDLPRGIPYIDAGVAAKRWVNVSDYWRLYELAERGGIYCDMDEEVLPGKDFDDMLGHSLFVGTGEDGWVGNSPIGSVPDHPLIREQMRLMESKFRGDEDFPFAAATETFTSLMNEIEGRHPGVMVYPPDYFTPYNHRTGTINVTPNTRLFHHCMKSWVDAAHYSKKDYLPRVAFVIPSLGRPEGLKRCVDSIDGLYYPKHLVTILADAGDDTVPVKVNRMCRAAKADAFFFAANDVEFSDPWCLYRAAKSSREHGLVAVNTGPLLPDKGNVCEHFLIRKDLFDRLGEVFSERFHHVGCDNLLWAKASRLGEAFRDETARLTHHHFSRGAPMDEVYRKGWSQVEQDRAVLKEELEKLDKG